MVQQTQFVHSIRAIIQHQMPTTGNHRKRLTKKEQEVLELIRHGKGTADIAKHMNITERTVKYHISNIMNKLNAKNRTHAVAIAMATALPTDDEKS